jgi:hypothetical protein
MRHITKVTHSGFTCHHITSSCKEDVMTHGVTHGVNHRLSQTCRPAHPTLADLAAGHSTSMIGTTVRADPRRGRWQRLAFDRSTALVADTRWPESVRTDVGNLAAGLARLHGMSTGLGSWFVPSGDVDWLDLPVPAEAADVFLLALLLADVGDPTHLRRLGRLVADTVTAVDQHRLARDRRRAAGPAVDAMTATIAGGLPW